MSKKILGLVVSVALLMVVLSGCFLLPQIDTFTPVIKVISPTANQTITVPTSTSSTNVTATASVVAHSPLQSVVVSLSKGGQVLVGNTPANGTLGQNTGVFSYTFTGLTPGTYTLHIYWSNAWNLHCTIPSIQFCKESRDWKCKFYDHFYSSGNTAIYF